MSSRGTRQGVGLLCAALVVLAGASQRAQAQEATAGELAARTVVQETIDAVLAVLRTDAPNEQKRRRIEAIAYERFDFDTISRLVLARNWRRMSESQRADFLEAFKRHLSLTYGENLDEYGEEEVVISRTRAERNGDVTVRSEILASATDPVPVDYRLRNRTGDWHVIDVIIDGVSMISNFRTQTQELISDVGTDGLIERLREKNAEREAKG